MTSYTILMRVLNADGQPVSEEEADSSGLR